MALSIIGPGFGRTGTSSLKIALEQIGFGPCHHMEEAFANPEQVPHWQAIAAGQAVDWNTVFAGYRAQVDWPGAHVWRELAQAFPQAKVVLSVRPEESWWKSYSQTIGKFFKHRHTLPMPSHIAAMAEAAGELIVEQTFSGHALDRDVALAAYRQRTLDVRAAIAPERLLVFDVAQGWEPLCDFLGVPVPGDPFPHRNSTVEFWEHFGGVIPPD
jgi:hypothetical protein